MPELPATSSFFSALDTTMSREEVARIYGALGWEVRKCTWEDYEVISDWAELIIEAESPILMHGLVDGLSARAEELVAPLRQAGISFTAECYGPEPQQELFLELRS